MNVNFSKQLCKDQDRNYTDITWDCDEESVSHTVVHGLEDRGFRESDVEWVEGEESEQGKDNVLFVILGLSLLNYFFETWILEILWLLRK